MAGGIIGTGAYHRRAATDAFGTSAKLEQRREREEDRLEQQERQQTQSAVATGASIGTTISPGWGTVIGAGIGLIAGELF